MKDEIWMRGWDEGHERFRADMDHGLERLGAAIRRWFAPASPRGTAPRGIGAQRA